MRKDPLLGVLSGKKRAGEEALAGKSTLNRLELSQHAPDRYKKIRYRQEAIDELLTQVFVEAHEKAPEQIVLGLDVTDLPLHGHQEGRFFHGHYDSYCYLPLYIFCGEHLLCARLRTADQDASASSVQEVEQVVARIRKDWPEVKITLRADSGFCREELMERCEDNNVHYVFGFTRNDRRMVAKAEQIADKENPRCVVTNLSAERWSAQQLYEDLYCQRGEMENRIKEQLQLFATRVSAETLRANQLRLYFSAMAYLLLHGLRRLGLKGTKMARAQVETIRLLLLKIGARLRITARKIWVSMASGYPLQVIFAPAWRQLRC